LAVDILYINHLYLTQDVSPEIFIKVLLGDEKGLEGVGSGKVLKR